MVTSGASVPASDRLTDQQLAPVTVNGDHGAGIDPPARGEDRPVDHLGLGGTDRGRDTPFPGHQGGVADQPPQGGEQAPGHGHAVDVGRGGLAPSQDDVDALVAQLDRGVGVEDQNPRTTPRGGGQPSGDNGEPGVVGRLDDRWRVVEVASAALDRLGPVNREVGVVGHLDGHPEGGDGAALASPGLQHPQPVLFHRELDVDHVAVVPLEQSTDPFEFGRDVGPALPQGRQRLGCRCAGHHILPLGPGQEVPHEAPLPRRRVAGEGHPGSRPVTEVAEDHGLHGRRGPEGAIDPLDLPVADRPGGGPALEHDPDGVGDLVDRVGGHGVPVGPQGGRHPFGRRRRRGVGQDLPRGAEHDLGVAEQGPLVGVGGEAGVAGERGQGPLHPVVHAQVENGVHHARHRDLGPRPDADQQRGNGRAELLTGAGLQPGQARSDRVVELGAPAVGQERAAGGGGQCEPGGHRQSGLGHQGQPGALASEQGSEVTLQPRSIAIERIGQPLTARHVCTSRPTAAAGRPSSSAVQYR